MKVINKIINKTIYILFVAAMAAGFQDAAWGSTEENVYRPVDIQIYVEGEDIYGPDGIVTDAGVRIPVSLTVINEKDGISSVYYSITYNGESSEYYTEICPLGEAETCSADACDPADAETLGIQEWNVVRDNENAVRLSKSVLLDPQKEICIELAFIDMKGKYFSYQRKYQFTEEVSAEETVKEESAEYGETVAEDITPEEDAETAEDFAHEENAETTADLLPEDGENPDEELLPENIEVLEEDLRPEETKERDEEFQPEETKATEEDILPEEIEERIEGSEEQAEDNLTEEFEDDPEDLYPYYSDDILYDDTDYDDYSGYYEAGYLDGYNDCYNDHVCYDNYSGYDAYGNYDTYSTYETYEYREPAARAGWQEADSTDIDEAINTVQKEANNTGDRSEKNNSDKKDNAIKEPDESEEKSSEKERSGSQKKGKTENKDGSVYEMNSPEDINGKYLKEAEDLVINEKNADKLKQDSIMVTVAKDGETFELERGKDYTFRLTGISDDLNTYTYRISRDVFAEDGVYRVFLNSEDESGNKNYNEAKDSPIRFSIDHTDPLIISYDAPADSRIRQLKIKDNISLDSVGIFIGGEQVEYENDGDIYSFTIPDNCEETDVKIIASDSAGNTYERVLNDYIRTESAGHAKSSGSVSLIIPAAVIAAAAVIIVLRLRKRARSHKPGKA